MKLAMAFTRARRLFLLTFSLGKEELGLYDAALSFIVGPGIVAVMAGSPSEDIRLKSAFEFAKK